MNYFETSKILAPYDFSTFSQAAVETAMKIAGKNENITVLHVVDPVPINFYGNGIGLDVSSTMDVGLDLENAAEIDHDHEASVLKMMQAEFGEAKHHGLNYDTALDEPAHGIAAYAEANEFDLIILPSHGRTGFKRLFIGSTAERVVRLAHCPVMVLRS